MSTTKKAKTKVSDMLVLAILAYLLTLVLPVLTAITNSRSFTAYIIANVICIATWILGAWALVKTAKKECGFNVISKEEKPSLLNWILISAITAAFIAYCLFIDEGFAAMSSKFSALQDGLAYFSFFFSFVLNAVQAVVITLIITFAQKMGDTALGCGKYIPYGGIFLGLCWALANIFTSLSGISEGYILFSSVIISALIMLAYGTAIGIIYLASGKKPLYALLFIALAFVLM